MKMISRFGLGLLLSSSVLSAHADDVKIGMITTLSGGGSHLGVDVRDGFMLALEQSAVSYTHLTLPTILRV